VANKGALVIRFVGDIRDLQKSSVKVSKSMSGMSKLGLGLAAGVGAVVAGVGALAVSTTKDMMRVERLGKQTENVIKATGGAAGRTRKQVDALAGRLERMSGAEAETVTEGQNMLLTFKNIKGKQFDAATKSMLDMGVAMNKGSLEGLDLQKTSILMGKALNDPIKGLTALSRVGVSFTDKQKKQIKTMQEAGNVAGAQKVILKELKSEFGGAAKAAGQTTEGMFAKIKNTFGNIAESTLSFVLPALMKLMTWVNKNVMPALVRFGDWLKNDGAAHLKAFGGWLKENVLPPLKTLGGFVVNTVVPGLVTLGKWLMNNREMLTAVAIGLGTALVAWKAYVFFTVTVPAIIKAITVAQKGLNVAMKANVIGIVITAIAALVAALVWFFTKTKAGKAIVKAVWSGIKSAIKGVSDWWTKTAWPAIKAAISAMGNWFRMVGRVVSRVWNGIGDAIGKAWNWIRRNVFMPIRIGIKLVAFGFRLYGKVIGAVWRAVGDGLGRVWSWIRRRVFSPIVTMVTKNLPQGFRNARDKVSAFFGGMRDRLTSVGKWIRANVFGRIGDALRAMREGFKNAVRGIGEVWARLKVAAAKPVNFLIKWVWNNGLRRVLNAIPGVELPEVKPVRFARGGPVRGGVAGRDSVRALMMPGEHVWTAREVQKAGGQRAMYAMRKAVLNGNLNGDPRFAKGGALDPAAIARAQKFARSQAGKPYGWGSVGPSSYDCSGFMSALTNVLRGQYPHSRVGSTASFPWGGFKRGPGQFTIGSTPNYGFSGVGHMAGTLGGLNVESRGSRGVLVGPGAMGALSPGFSQMYHLGSSGAAAMNDGSGGWLDTIGKVLSAMRKLPGQIAEMMSGGSWIASFLRKLTAGLWSNLARHINKLIPDIGPIKTNPIPAKLARGAIVRHRPGGVFANIAEGGHDEAVIPLSGPHAPRGGRPIEVNLHLDGKRVAKVIIDPLRGEIKNISGGDVQKALGRGRSS
jgi:hypothetical protein